MLEPNVGAGAPAGVPGILLLCKYELDCRVINGRFLREIAIDYAFDCETSCELRKSFVCLFDVCKINPCMFNVCDGLRFSKKTIACQ